MIGRINVIARLIGKNYFSWRVQLYECTQRSHFSRNRLDFVQTKHNTVLILLLFRKKIQRKLETNKRIQTPSPHSTDSLTSLRVPCAKNFMLNHFSVVRALCDVCSSMSLNYTRSVIIYSAIVRVFLMNWSIFVFVCSTNSLVIVDSTTVLCPNACLLVFFRSLSPSLESLLCLCLYTVVRVPLSHQHRIRSPISCVYFYFAIAARLFW